MSKKPVVRRAKVIGCNIPKGHVPGSMAHPYGRNNRRKLGTAHVKRAAEATLIRKGVGPFPSAFDCTQRNFIPAPP